MIMMSMDDTDTLPRGDGANRCPALDPSACPALLVHAPGEPNLAAATDSWFSHLSAVTGHELCDLNQDLLCKAERTWS
jgi:hypothetical protein